MRVQALSNAASLLSGNSGSMITRLQSASAYANQVASLGNIAGQFTRWQQTIGNNLSTMGQTLGLQQSQQQEARPRSCKPSATALAIAHRARCRRSRPATSWRGANAAQLAQIQATLSATAQMQATGMAVHADRRGHGGRRDAAVVNAHPNTDHRSSGGT